MSSFLLFLCFARFLPTIGSDRKSIFYWIIELFVFFDPACVTLSATFTDYVFVFFEGKPKQKCQVALQSFKSVFSPDFSFKYF